MTNRPLERDQIRLGMDRLLEGRPIQSDGALTVVSLAAESGVKRHVLTHRHTDLKDEFYRRVRAQGSMPESEVRLRRDLAHAGERLSELRERVRQLNGEVEIFARVVNVLTTENEALRAPGAARGRVVPIHGRGDGAVT